MVFFGSNFNIEKALPIVYQYLSNTRMNARRFAFTLGMVDSHIVIWRISKALLKTIPNTKSIQIFPVFNKRIIRKRPLCERRNSAAQQRQRKKQK